MLFKKSLVLILISSTVLATMGCTDFINGKKAKPEVIEFSDARFACLKNLPPSLKKFSAGEAQPEEIRQGFDCASQALLYFEKKTYGADPSSYTIEEMRRFFGKYFLKENNVTPEFATELMRLKQALLGGSDKNMSKAEITRLVDLLAVVRDEAVQISPHIQVLLTKSLTGTDWDKVSAATEQLRTTLQKILDNTQLAKSDYSFDDAKKALKGLGDFIKGNETYAPYDTVESWIPLAESVKNVLIGRHAQMTKLYQWKDSLNTIIDLYGLALKYHYVIQDLKFNDALEIRQASQFAGQVLDLIDNCQQMKTNGNIPLDDIDTLIDQLMPKVQMPFRAESLKVTYRAFILRLLEPGRNGDSRGIDGLEKKHIAALRREFNVWRLNQSFVDGLKLDSKGQVSQAQILSTYKSFNFNLVITRGLTSDPFEQVALKNAWSDLGNLLQAPIMVQFNSKGRIVETYNSLQVISTWKSMTKFNVMSTLARLLLMGYGENNAGKISGARMAKEGLSTWYDDFNDLMTDIKAFDPRTGNSGPRSFQEANFFTFSGNGDDWMDQRETFEFVSILFSAGMGTSDAVREDMASCYVSQKDIFDYPYMTESCFKEKMRKNFANYFDNLPNMARFVGTLNDADWNQFYDLWKATGLVADQKAGLIETSNIRTMVQILHYVESVMILFDKDQNQTLSKTEVYGAAPRFLSFFRTMKPDTGDTLLTEGFAYLVFKGEQPGAAQLAKFQFEKLWGLKEADRSSLMRLFGNLKQQLNKATN